MVWGSDEVVLISSPFLVSMCSDPDAEVVALSPEALMATNRFFCEICSKGFPRDQNLQLHRREHNLPWNLRGSGDKPRKRVYVCPVSTCVYHSPARALGDLTGMKKHFFRKHGGEKKYECEHCSKKYAVLSDWQAHVRACSGFPVFRWAPLNPRRASSSSLFPRSNSFLGEHRRRHKEPDGETGKDSYELNSATALGSVSYLGTINEQRGAASSPVINPVLELQQVPATLLQQQQQGQLVLAGFLLFYDCNQQSPGSTAMG